MTFSSTLTGTTPLAMQLARKIGLKEGATTARMPYSANAHTACSRLEPQPKLSPVISMLKPRRSGLFRMNSGSGVRLPIDV